MTANGVGTCGADDNQAQAGHLIVTALTTRAGATSHALTSEGADASEDGTGRGTPIIGFHFGSHPGYEIDATTTLTGRNGDPGAFTDGVIVRRLTPLECERLQGFPDEWTDIPGSSDSARYRQMGNSVAVPVLAWVLGRLAAVDSLEAVA